MAADKHTTLTMDTLNPQIEKMEYAVRGPLMTRALQIQKDLREGSTAYPFKEVIRANLGDAHAMGQAPLTFVRQVLACISYPELLNSGDMPADVKEKAKRIIAGCGGGSVGAYTTAWGIEVIRNDVAAYISARDGGIPSNPDNITLCGGASEGIRAILNLFNKTTADGKVSGVMVPIPQYPLYSASVVEFGMEMIPYYLDEDKNWGLDIAELERALDAKRNLCNPRVIVVINPGNPTGQVLNRADIEGVIKFAHRNNLFVFADEVYQENVYAAGCAFHSFKKVMNELGAPYNTMELASFHSVSKGFFGECGLRGGYAEVCNMDPDVKGHYRKSISSRLCSTVIGQAVVECLVNRPKPGDPSYELFEQEKKDRLSSLAARAKSVEETFNAIEGVHCNAVQGAMYAFPRISFPEKAIEAAKAKGQKVDFMYCMELLETMGICIVPGSGFGQREGTYHFRTTILPQPPLLKSMLEKYKDFHLKFMARYK